MVGCCVKSCKNSFAKGFKMCKIPRDPQTKLEWAIRINRRNFDPRSQYYVCEVHFQRDMWQLLPGGRKLLKKGAVPTLFGRAVFTKPMGDNLEIPPSELNINNLRVGRADDVKIEIVADSSSESSLEQKVREQQASTLEMQEEIRHLREQLHFKDCQLDHLRKLSAANQEYREYFEEKYHSTRETLAQMKSHVDVVGCYVKGCKSSSARGFQMFSFPADPSRRQQWIENIFGPHWIPETHNCVCEVHFEDDMWTTSTTGEVRLKDTAVPTFFVKHEPAKEELEEPVFVDCVSTSVKAQPSPQYLSDEDDLFKNVLLDADVDYLFDAIC